jgi:inner membrane protein
MDTVTQALLGATVAQAGFASRLGRRRALGWGAVAGLMPDLDVVAVATHGPFGEFLYHRGITHGLCFGPVMGPLLGVAAWGAGRRRRGSTAGLADPVERRLLAAWIWLFVLVLFTHPLLDVFTTYGTQLFAPFSDRRFALDGVAIIDPFYSGLLVAALLLGLLVRERPRLGAGIAAAALALSTAYLFYGVHLNRRAELEVTRQLQEQGVVEALVQVYPTIFQPYLRRVVARTPDQILVGLTTSLRPSRLFLERFSPPEHPLVEKLRSTREGSIFVWFAMGEVAPRVIEQADDRTLIEIDDLRYGYPGSPDQGIWGIRALFDERGELVGRVQRFNRRRSGRVPSLESFWRAVQGDFGAMGAAAGGG